MTNKPSAVIIGAGQSGRGFVSRFFFNSGYHLTFIDKNEKTVKYLQEDNFFTIHCFDESVKPVHIHDFSAFITGSTEAENAVVNADILLISVGQQNLPAVAADIVPAILRRRTMGLPPLGILVCENGVSPGQIFADALCHQMGGGTLISKYRSWLSSVRRMSLRKRVWILVPKTTTGLLTMLMLWEEAYQLTALSLKKK